MLVDAPAMEAYNDITRFLLQAKRAKCSLYLLNTDVRKWMLATTQEELRLRKREAQRPAREAREAREAEEAADAAREARRKRGGRGAGARQPSRAHGGMYDDKAPRGGGVGRVGGTGGNEMHGLLLALSELLTFANGLFNYLVNRTAHGAWDRFVEQAQGEEATGSVAHLQALHLEYLNAIRQHCLLDEAMGPIREKVRESDTKKGVAGW
jgi:hypothetical protein